MKLYILGSMLKEMIYIFVNFKSETVIRDKNLQMRDVFEISSARLWIFYSLEWAY